jgi:hypothetical protein
MPLLTGNLPKLQNKKVAAITINDFEGVNIQKSDTRLKKTEAKTADNCMLNEDGVWDKRWGTLQYGVTFDNDIDGFVEYRKTDGTTELIVVEGGSVWRMTTTAKTQITGASLTAGYDCFFCQTGTYLYICNGQDAITRYDGSTLSQYSALTTPTNLALSRLTLSTGSYTYYYRVSASNAVGETAACAEVSIAVNEARDVWSSGDGIKLDWTAVSKALKYVIYFSDTSGYEVKLTEVTTNTYSDLGTETPNPYIEPPDGDTSGGPKLKTICVSQNRIWGTEPDNPYRVYLTGTGVDLGNFSPAYGGGWVELERGGINRVNCVVDFQNQPRVLCDSPNGRGTIWEVDIETQSLADTSFTVPIPTKIIGSSGTNAPRTVTLVENDVAYLNRWKASILGNEPGVLNVLRVNEFSEPLRPYIKGLNGGSFSKNCSYYYDAKIFYSVATGSGDPDRIMVFDREKLRWYKEWTIGITQFGEFTDSGGVTHFLGSLDNKIVEFSEVYEGDDGTAFQQHYTSGLISIVDDWTKFGKIKRAFVKLRNTRGSVQFSFNGTGKTEVLSTLASESITEGTSDTGIGWDLVGAFQVGSTNGTPTFFASESVIRYLMINKLLREMQFDVQTSGTSLVDRFCLTGLMAEGYQLPTARPSDWRLGS